MPDLRMTVMALLTGLVGTTVVTADVVSPRVDHEQAADRYSLATWTRSEPLKSLSDAEFALQIFDTLTDPRQGLRLADIGPSEGPDKIADFARVADPIKLCQVYGYGDESQLAATFVAVWEASGRGRGRVVLLGDSGRVLSEVESQGAWWTFDIPRRATFPTADGFASVNDLRTNETLWTSSTGPRTYSADLAAQMRPLIASSSLRMHYFPYASAYAADFVLRPGESFSRYFTPQGRRWLIPSVKAKDKTFLAQLDAEPAGPKTVAGTDPVHANGVFVYAPTLQGDGSHFADGVANSENLEVTDKGLTLIKDGVGSAIFEIRSPYVIVPELGKLDDPKDDKEASVIEIDAAEATLTYSPDNGATWLTLDAKKFPATIDLTEQVSGTYGYLLRIELKGKRDAALVQSLKITTWVQIARSALPTVQPGVNRFQVRTGDQFGLKTRAYTAPISTADDNAFLAPVIRPPRELHSGNATARVLGPFTLRVSPPVGTRLAWFTLGGRFACDREHPEATSVRLGYAVGQPADYQALDVAPPPPDHAGADLQVDRIVKLSDPATAAYGVVEGRPALNDLRLVVHGVDVTPRAASPWVITHRWRENGEAREHSATVTGAATGYELTAGDQIVNESVEFRVP